MIHHTLRVAAVLFAVAQQAVVPSAQQDLLDRVKLLYAAAAYEDALAAMPSGAALDTELSAGAIDQYRALCLVALNRPEEAMAAIERVITRDPLFVPQASETSPRLQSMYADARGRLIPDLAKRTYADAKSALQANNPAAARTAFQRTALLIESAPEKEKAALDDLRVLALEFSELTAGRPTSGSAAPGASAAPAGAPPAAAALPRIEAVALNQSLPPWLPPDVLARRTEYRGLIRITIGTDGKVEAATVVRPSHPQYDALALRAARQWRYAPATRGGVAVRTERDVEVHLRPQ